MKELVSAVKSRYDFGGFAPGGIIMQHQRLSAIFSLVFLLIIVPGCSDKQANHESTCGNGIREEGEGCDDGNLIANDGCNAECQVTRGFSCHKGAGGADICQPLCGDGVVIGNEECDDGNTDSCDTCTAECKLNFPRCGDGFKCGNEECDDGNTDDCDGCLATCKLHNNICGDGIVCAGAGEACDDGNRDPCDGCDSNCNFYAPLCGDGIVCPGESCDDGNKNNCDSCSNDCKRNFNRCGDGVACGNEECDLGDINNNSCSGCSESCKLFVNTCGDGVICGAEHCDDPTNALQGLCDQKTCTLDGNTDTAYPALRKNRRLKKVWADEFNGPVPGREECYGDSKKAICRSCYWCFDECDKGQKPTNAQLESLGLSELAIDLADLDKCTWNVFSLYNWMDSDKPLGSGVNAFHPSMVKVKDGTLILSSIAFPPKSGYDDSWSKNTSIHTILESYDCGRDISETSPQIRNSIDCPIISGAVDTEKTDLTSGYNATYGRWEVRAKLPIGEGSWPAHWMLPQKGGWPNDGEIDIMEAFSKKAAVEANFHDGNDYYDDEGNLVESTHSSMGGTALAMSFEQQNEEFHIYTVEWTPHELRFYVDNHYIGGTKEGELAKTKSLITGNTLDKSPLDIPDIPFYLILNSTVHARDAEHYPHPMDFPRQTHTIDYVRRYEDCNTDDYCPAGGTYTNGHCLFAKSASQLFQKGADIFYQAVSGACPNGGTLAENRCVIFSGDNEKIPVIVDNTAGYLSPCVESTISPSCTNPCGGIGEFIENRCVIFRAPLDYTPQVTDNFITMPQINKSGVKPCPYGREKGSICEIGPVPAGKTVLVKGNDVYFTPSCQPAASMPNCAFPCPNGGYFDGRACFYGMPPAGTTASATDGAFYYTLPSGASACPLGTLVENTNKCRAYSWPEGAIGQVADNKFYLKAACSKVPISTFHGI